MPTSAAWEAALIRSVGFSLAAAWVGVLRQMHDMAMVFTPALLAANLFAGYLTGRIRVIARPSD